MAEYIEREALLERIDGIYDCADMVFEPNDHCCRADDCASCKWRETKAAIRKIAANIPAADVVPVVLCRDCLHYEMGVCLKIYDKPHAPREIRHLQRWCNNKIIFKKVPRFEEYSRSKG